MYRKLIFELSKEGREGHTLPRCDVPVKKNEDLIPDKYLRHKAANLPQVAENEVVRHFVMLSTLNHHVDKAFYPLGSCTMKYNPKINERLAGLPGFMNLHPEQPAEKVQGALRLMYELGELLKEITGFSAITLQPAAGAQGELTGLLLIKKYHQMKGRQRTVILVPDSAHGTNPASAAICGFRIKTVRSTEQGLVDMEDLKAKTDENVAGIMLTNPSTLGIFETQLKEIRAVMDEVDALMYMDGANLNALFGIVRPGETGFDVMHINLHKSFSTPHGGGGPGSGPVAVNDKLKDYLPAPIIIEKNGRYLLEYNLPESIGSVHTFYGNFAIFVRAYAYIRILGKSGLPQVTRHAIINANYLKAQLKELFELEYPAPTMHEFVLSAEKQKKRGAKALDIAKRLLDYGVHPPTVYFPLIVKEAMMIEPTESESKEMLDVFVQSLKQIDREIDENLETVLQAPHNTPVRRLDEAGAVKNLNINYFKNKV
ncbi:aminomethyl-transferring glycine dehydrogenase subunit GcvPB [Caldithrix abyssi]|uniref:Probable glycine dehydrogenase (decarboxylating) subunit 2 n=1 Tax=Caldithrix abyssi DSM 13497 TaxID=880073 RepID=H1XT96_CALAY|nr:aminomethyl-transferring glycine dehydrogenase subunit GcvPB [Caldithrix abyssi]APF18679.1 gcvPB glycine dehydrogenase (decarboxylating) beta subunit [Caldithrix abyssi DSM 13497]EHO42663.1 glycine dehydrogenase (decarboxylating) subunit 2 [Caldithrix abyssi DSM 13497]